MLDQDVLYVMDCGNASARYIRTYVHMYIYLCTLCKVGLDKYSTY